MTVLLAARDLRFGYRSGEELFGGLSLELTPGTMWSVTGASGSGKSTLLYVLGLLLAPRHGSVVVDGNDVSGLSDRERSLIRARTMGFVFQDAALDPARSVIDNVTEPAQYVGRSRRSVEARARSLLEQFGVLVRAGHRPGQISGGQAQRVALCRALVNQPAILLADEPTGNLDEASADVVLTALATHAERGGGVLVATHDPAVRSRCSHRLDLESL